MLSEKKVRRIIVIKKRPLQVLDRENNSSEPDKAEAPDVVRVIQTQMTFQVSATLRILHERIQPTGGDDKTVFPLQLT